MPFPFGKKKSRVEPSNPSSQSQSLVSSASGHRQEFKYSSSQDDISLLSSPPPYSDTIAGAMSEGSAASNDTGPFAWTQKQIYLLPPDRPLRSSAMLLPLPRWGHSAHASTTSTGDIYFFGGLKGDHSTNDLYVLSAKDLYAKPLPPTSETPSPRVGHASALIASVLIVWGGDDSPEGQIDVDALDDSLYMLNLRGGEWTKVAVDGAAPPGRYGHGAAVVGSKFYVFGGQCGTEFLNDLWSFDVNDLRSYRPSWTQISKSSLKRPPARTAMTCLPYQDKIVMFGGTDGVSHFNDTWIFDTKTSTWSLQYCYGDLPPSRDSHAAAMVEDIMYIYGGRGPEGREMRALGALDLSTSRWLSFRAIGTEPQATAGHKMITAGSRIVVLGGGDSGGGGFEDPNVIGILDTKYIRFTNHSSAPSGSTTQHPSLEKTLSLENSGEDPKPSGPLKIVPNRRSDMSPTSSDPHISPQSQMSASPARWIPGSHHSSHMSMPSGPDESSAMAPTPANVVAARQMDRVPSHSPKAVSLLAASLSRANVSSSSQSGFQSDSTSTVGDTISSRATASPKPGQVSEGTTQETIDIMHDLFLSSNGQDNSIPSEHRKRMRQTLRKLCYESGKLPTRLSLEGVICENRNGIHGGSFSDIFRGHYQGRTVALKRLRNFTDLRRHEKQESMKMYFHREALLWSLLSHEHVLPFLGTDSTTFSPMMCLILPWMENGNAVDYLTKLIPYREGLQQLVHKWMCQIAQGLAYLHGEDIVHGDLRGVNILIDDNEQVRLADFGLARLAAVSNETMTSGNPTNAHWAAPEILHPEHFNLTSSRPTMESDVYSFACVCVELYTCQPPFQQCSIAPFMLPVSVVRDGLRPPQPTFCATNEAMPDGIWSLLVESWLAQRLQRPTAANMVPILRGHSLPLPRR